MDVSKEGWGGHLARRRGDLHTVVDAIGQTLHPELLAVRQTIKHSLPQLHGAAVVVLSDNSTTVVYINKEGGTQLPSLCQLALQLWKWCRQHQIFPVAMDIAGSRNFLADALSRWTHHPPTDWSLHKVVVRAMFEHWPVPCIDPFASERNHKLLVFFSMCPSRTFVG